MQIPFYSFKRQIFHLKEELLKEFNIIFNCNEYEPELLNYVAELERSFANYCDVSFGVGTDSGTGALQLSLLASGVKIGDEVITTPNTYIATALAISNIGAKPVFVDINPDTFNIDPYQIEGRINEKTKAIIPVYLYGQSSDMDPILNIAKKDNLVVIEDACQAHGSTYNNKKVGSMGHIGCFSFYSSKNLSGFGNGGMIVSNNKKIIDIVKNLRDPESNTLRLLQSRRTPAYLDSIQAAIIKIKLKYLDKWNQERREIAKLYTESLSNIVKTPIEGKNVFHTYHSYVIRTDKRDELKDFLGKNGIRTSIEYSPSIHLTKTFSPLGYKLGDHPEAEKAEKEILSLPIYPELNRDELNHIINTIRKFFV
ncbi:MAG TPA: DegT/DnrJ/EryC1/StrS family aminotransferase [Candidatus Woesearchaeota archaeon]|jgi:dTDP-4-amino-4,6-dideoxygalactose transaminase|nr:DegT/DnrJ/EryC1/StrS family aminotransferase [Candidatus Woesearchaeota archaeon]HJN56366.1 DegT/DnrJ/EryC1/StrS family aminotransferase [Candidatus Woesearchaeota archaeon]|tara:strand:+ start:1749 stop:2852 length:1104 start_codon:yes stop_codon:yes gene_type:complete